MSTPRTDEVADHLSEKLNAMTLNNVHVLMPQAIAEILGLSTSLETALAAMRKERDEWMELSVKSSQEREHNAMMALAYKADLTADRGKVAKLRDALKDTSEALKQCCKDHGDTSENEAGALKLATAALADTAPKEEAK